ncbi:MAG: ECF transporter S component [Clostridiales bacterium]|jgi:niacin transporter|nr:ECF transporter S component [Clostridiales bacterium]
MNTERKNNVYRLTIGGLLLAIGIIIPRMFHIFGTGEIGKVLLPMHLGVFIAGIYLGASYGAIIGFITPLINSIFGLPMFPHNLIMAIELAAYGFFAGLTMYLLQKNNIKRMRRSFRVYISLIVSMILGRLINALALFIMARVFAMTVPAPLTVFGSALTAIPGILIQLVLVPAIIFTLYASQERYVR